MMARSCTTGGLIVSILIFGLGGGASVYEGVTHMRDATLLRDVGWSYATLGMAALFEGISFLLRCVSSRPKGPARRSGAHCT